MPPLLLSLPPLRLEYALLKLSVRLAAVRSKADVRLVLCTQHLAKAEEAEAEALITFVAARIGFLPVVRIDFLEKSIRVIYISREFKAWGGGWGWCEDLNNSIRTHYFDLAVPGPVVGRSV